MSVIGRVPMWFRLIVLVAVLGAVSGIVYLRYFYGNDAPPPLELSPTALLMVRPRRGAGTGGRSGSRRPMRSGQGGAARRIAVAAALGSLLAPLALVQGAGAATAVKAKAGAKCTKAGATGTAGTTALVCTKVGKTLVWKAKPAAASTTVAAAAAPRTTAAAASGASASPAPSAGIEGTYKSTTGSVAGYRVRELFVGGVAKVDAVGRSEAVTASVTLARAGSALVARNLTATVDMTQIKSDETRRDSRMRTQGLETDKFGTATFVGAGDVTLPDNAEKGEAVKVTITGKLTLHGVTRDVEIPADARLADGTLEVVGRLAIKMPDWGIEPPEIPDFVKADDDGQMEFKLVMKKA
jgi:polyisoprenoid-binding protein YceI